MSANSSDDTEISPILDARHRHRMLSIGSDPRFLPVLRELQSEGEKDGADRLPVEELDDRLDIDVWLAIGGLKHANLVRSWREYRGQVVALTGNGDVVLDAIDEMIDTEVEAIRQFSSDDDPDS
jgi:hypothetical protein